MFMESYRVEKREEGDRGGQDDKRGGMKRSESDPVSNLFHKCPPPSGIHRDSEIWVEKRRGREETEVA